MITRAQAEALLTLAESLEACERLDTHLVIPGRCEIELHSMGDLLNLDLSGSYLDGQSIRATVEALIPKQEI